MIAALGVTLLSRALSQGMDTAAVSVIRLLCFLWVVCIDTFPIDCNFLRFQLNFAVRWGAQMLLRIRSPYVLTL